MPKYTIQTVLLFSLLSALLGKFLSSYTHPSSSSASFSQEHKTTPEAVTGNSMTALKAGDTFPPDVVFSTVFYTPESASLTSCGVPQNYAASQEWSDKKVVLFGVPGAFTPGCSVRHLPGFIERLQQIKAGGVDVVAVVAMNDAWVMNAWSKANGVVDDDILFLSDPDVKFGQSIGWASNGRLARFAMIIDHGKVVYAEKEPGREVTVSGAEAVLVKL